MTIAEDLIVMPRTHGGPWREEIRGRAIELADRAEKLPDGEIKTLLEAAMKAADAEVRLGDWWTGRHPEEAWTELHAAENRLAELTPVDRAEAVARDALQHAERLLPADDPRVVHLRRQLGPDDAAKTRTDQERRALHDDAVRVLRAAHVENELLYEEARAFRDRLLVMGLLSIFASVGLVVVQALLPGTPLLKRPPGTTLAAWQLLALVVAFGCFGAYVSSLPALSRMSRGHSPFNLPIPQAVLKVGAGAVTAVTGLLLMSTGVVNDQFSSVQAVLALAVVFGAGQQAVTKSLDDRATKLVADMDKPAAGQNDHLTRG